MRWQLSILIFCACAIITSCKVSYSFTGADIPAEAQTFSVQYFNSEAVLATPTYAQVLTEELKDLLLAQSGLKLTTSNGDLQYSGVITNYEVTPVALQGNETAARNRLTISLKVSYVNIFDETKNFEKSFSRFADYDSSNDLSQVEEGLIETINEQLIQDIFNASLGNW